MNLLHLCETIFTFTSRVRSFPFRPSNAHVLQFGRQKYWTHSLKNCRPQNVPNYVPVRIRILLEKLNGSKLVKKFPTFYCTRRFITAYTTACHLSLSCARLVQSKPPSHNLKTHFNITLLSTPASSRRSVVPRPSHQNPVCTSPVSHTCYAPYPSHSS